jgi:type II secretory pathway pseudopilin PulG
VRNQARNDYGVSARCSSRGIALLVMLSLILVVFTTVAISRLSLNSIAQKKNEKTVEALARARDAILGFALMQQNSTPTVLRPVGTLPCPDIDGDGVSDGVGVCTRWQGLVPFRTLGLSLSINGAGALRDGAGAPLWYAIPANYGGNVTPATALRNSSLASALRLNGAPMAFIVIAPGEPLSGQNPRTSPLAAVNNFLEGVNATGDPNFIFNDLFDLTHNDKLLGMPLGAYWSIIEARVLANVRDLIRNYRSACGSYPDAVPYGNNNDNSFGGTTAGRVPLGTASPCAVTIGAPNWVITHWTKMLYYQFCNPATPACLDLNTRFVSALVMSPGIPLPVLAQARPPQPPPPLPPTLPANYFEAQNSTPDLIFTDIQLVNHTATFNDLISVIPFP